MKKNLQIVAALLASLCFARAQDESRPAPAAPPPTPTETAPAAPTPLPATPLPRTLPSGRVIKRTPAPTPAPIDPTTGLPLPIDPTTGQASQPAPAPVPPPIDPRTGLPITPGQLDSATGLTRPWPNPKIDPATGLPVASTSPSANPLATGAFEEEGNLDIGAAMTSYQSVISRFDGERPEAANAIFRLGECYRKLGRIEEAKVQYARILREFPDQVELTKLSQKYLSEPVRGQPRFQQRLQAIVKRAPEKTATAQDKRFLKQQIDLYQERIDALQKDPSRTVPSSSSAKDIFDLKLQLIQLKDQLAAMEKAPDATASSPTSAARPSTKSEPSEDSVTRQRAMMTMMMRYFGRYMRPGAEQEIMRNLTNGSPASEQSPAAPEPQSLQTTPADTALNPVAQEKILIQEQIKLVQKKLDRLRESRKQNLVSDDSVDDAKMRLLDLQRELAEWDAKHTVITDIVPPLTNGGAAERRDTNNKR